MTLSQYIERLNTRYKTGISTEHSNRGDIGHYQKIIAALNETDRLMTEINKIDIE